MNGLIAAAAAAAAAAAVTEAAVRAACDAPVKTDFYSSVPRDGIGALRRKEGLHAFPSDTSVLLGWIADPDRESGRIFLREADGTEKQIGEAKYGSFSVRDLQPGSEYVFSVRFPGDPSALTAAVKTLPEVHRRVRRPQIAGPWHELFRPGVCGDYVNDHTLWQARDGSWHLAGITAHGRGDYTKEKYFCHARCSTFPFSEGAVMEELPPIADEGHPAWAPCVTEANGKYYMWYSPHRAYCQTSPDGVDWSEEPALGFYPAFPQFRDPMVLKLRENWALMYATARHGYYSSVDFYQSFDAEHWQYAGQALRTAFGCEKAGPQASTESPFVFLYDGEYYLSVTYNNASPALDTVLHALKIWPGRESYNETLLFRSGDPADFGTYRGRRNSPSLAGRLRAHAPEYLVSGNRIYLTTAGWPWVSTITQGEAAWAELKMV